MRHRLSGIAIYGLNGLWQGVEQPVYTVQFYLCLTFVLPIVLPIVLPLSYLLIDWWMCSVTVVCYVVEGYVGGRETVRKRWCCCGAVQACECWWTWSLGLPSCWILLCIYVQWPGLSHRYGSGDIFMLFNNLFWFVCVYCYRWRFGLVVTRWSWSS